MYTDVAYGVVIPAIEIPSFLYAIFMILLLAKYRVLDLTLLKVVK